jgi:hypothetical protein
VCSVYVRGRVIWISSFINNNNNNRGTSFGVIKYKSDVQVGAPEFASAEIDLNVGSFRCGCRM